MPLTNNLILSLAFIFSIGPIEATNTLLTNEVQDASVHQPFEVDEFSCTQVIVFEYKPAGRSGSIEIEVSVTADTCIKARAQAIKTALGFIKL